MSLTMFSYTCAYSACGASFQRRSAGKRKHRYCCLRCANLDRRKITTELLAPYAEKGTKTWKIAAELKVAPSALLTALRRHGLYNLWCQRRYRKCAFQMDGSLSASTASEASVANTPSARSELRTA